MLSISQTVEPRVTYIRDCTLPLGHFSQCGVGRPLGTDSACVHRLAEPRCAWRNAPAPLSGWPPWARKSFKIGRHGIWLNPRTAPALVGAAPRRARHSAT